MSITNDELLEQFFKFEALLRRYQNYHSRSHGPVVNPHRGQGRILGILKLQPEISQKELSYLLDMRNQSLSELLFKLEQKGFITRTPSEQDRRVMKVSLTPEGELAAEESTDRQSSVDELFKSFTDEEKDMLNTILKRLIQNANEQLAATGGDDHVFARHFEGGYPPHRRGMGHGSHEDVRDNIHTGLHGNMRGGLHRGMYGGMSRDVHEKNENRNNDQQ